MALRDDLLELRRTNREELEKLSTSLGLIAALVSTLSIVLGMVLWGAVAVGDIDWIDGHFWWVFLAVVIAIGWSFGGVPLVVEEQFRRRVLMLRRELDNGLWFFIADDSAWDLLRERQAGLPLLAPLNAPRPQNVPDQIRVAASYHRSLIALNRGRDPGGSGFSAFSSCTLLMDRFDNTCCGESQTLTCMTCGGLVPAVILWPLALWPLGRYIQYKAAVDEFSRFLLADGSAGESDAEQAEENDNNDHATG